jgi:hypothetical protein
MLEIRKTAVSFDEGVLMELERIVTDGDEKEALRFIVFEEVVSDLTPGLAHHGLESHGCFSILLWSSSFQ